MTEIARKLFARQISFGRLSFALTERFLGGVKSMGISRYLALLVLVFSVFYLPHVFIFNEDINLVSAVDVDAGSIFYSIDSLFSNYNMLETYHAKYYGWAFYWICFILVAPLKLAFLIAGKPVNSIFYGTIRFIHFGIGLGSVLVLYEVVKRGTKNPMFAFCAALLWVVPPGFQLFYFIHPDTTGSLFTLGAMLCLFNFLDKPTLRNYLVGLICLVLASLSKPIFFFGALPILFAYFHTYCIVKKKKYREFLFSKELFKTLLLSGSIACGILFIIHPYAFIKFKDFVIYQRALSITFVSGSWVVSELDSLKAWVKAIGGMPLLAGPIVVSPLALWIAFSFYRKTKSPIASFYLINLVGGMGLLFLIVKLNRVYQTAQYLMPCYPWFILSSVGGVFYLWQRAKGWARALVLILSTTGALIALSMDLWVIIPTLLARLNTTESAACKSFEYVRSHLGANEKIVFDHHVAVPSSMMSRACHYWQGCGTDYIDKFLPDVVMFNEEYQVVGRPHEPTLRLAKYVRDHKLVLVDTISDHRGIRLSVYRKRGASRTGDR